MSPFITRLSTAVGVTALLTLAQVPRRAEERYLAQTVEQIGRRNGLDPATQERIRRAFLQGSDKASHRADTDILRALQAKQFGLDEDQAGHLLVLAEPSKTQDSSTLASLSTRLWNEVRSEIRRRSILDEIGSGRSEQLTKERLVGRLSTLHVYDAQQVADSFDDQISPVVRMILPRDITLLRLCGRESKPLGRFFFCCEWTGRAGSWSDVSGLAMPPGNNNEMLALVTVPAGKEIFVGIVADNFANALGMKERGGNTQIFIPTVDASSLAIYRRGSDFAIVGNDRIVRFRPLQKR